MATDRWADLLKILDWFADETNRAVFKQQWGNLRDLLSRRRIGELRQVYQAAPGRRNELSRRFKDGPAGPVEARAMALWAFVKLEEKEALPELLDLMRNEPDPDLRGWAIFDLLLLKLPIGVDDSARVLPEIKKQLNHSGSQHVRTWAAHLLGKLGEKIPAPAKARDASLAGPITALNPENSYYCGNDAYQLAEAYLREQWRQEINLDVNRQLVESLGWIGGYDLNAGAEADGVYPIARVFREAATFTNQRVSDLVPYAVAATADNILNHVGGYTDEIKARAVSQLLAVLKDWLRRYFRDEDSNVEIGPNEAAMIALKKLIEILDWASRSKEHLLAVDSLLVRAKRENYASIFDCVIEVLRRKDLAYDSYRMAMTAAMRIFEEMLPAEMDLTARIPATFLREELENLVKHASDNPSEDVRARLCSALRDLASKRPNLQGWLRDVLFELFQGMLADPSDKVRQEAGGVLSTILNATEGMTWLSQIILSDAATKEVLQRQTLRPEQKTNATDEQQAMNAVKRSAALTLALYASQPATVQPGVFQLLIQGMRDPDPTVSKNARDALRWIGTEQSVQAIVRMDTRKYVDEKFFGPVEKAEEDGRRILNDMQVSIRVNHWVTLVVSSLVTLIGVALAVVSLVVFIQTKVNDWSTLAPALSGVLLAFGGLLAPFFWNPAQAIQKTTGQMANLITGVNGYLARARLVGLGFAHTYTTKKGERVESSFLTTLSDELGDAMKDSAQVFESIGRGPLVEPDLTTVLDFTGNTLEIAKAAAKAKSLRLEELPAENHASIEAGKIISQDVRAGVEVRQNSTVGVVVSKGPKE